MHDLFSPITKQQFFSGDAREVLSTLEDESVQCCVTSPPYFGLRDYGHEEQIGLEKTPSDFISNLVEVFSQIHRVLKENGVLWVNIGDSYASFKDGKVNPDSTRQQSNTGSADYVAISDVKASNRRRESFEGTSVKNKDLIGIPWMLAFAMREAGWYVRQEIIWHKPNPMPESVRDRCTKAHETIFMFTKSERYFFDHEAIKEPAKYHTGTSEKSRPSGYYKGKRNKRQSSGKAQQSFKHISDMRNKRSVWTVPTSRFKGAHFATFPPELVEPCVLSSSRPGDVVIDPFGGSGTINLLCKQHNRNGIYIDCNEEYLDLAKGRVECLTL